VERDPERLEVEPVGALEHPAGDAAVHAGTIRAVSKIWAPFIRGYMAVVVTSQNRARFK
jgi:hypothetical protein